MLLLLLFVLFSFSLVIGLINKNEKTFKLNDKNHFNLYSLVSKLQKSEEYVLDLSKKYFKKNIPYYDSTTVMPKKHSELLIKILQKLMLRNFFKRYLFINRA